MTKPKRRFSIVGIVVAVAVALGGVAVVYNIDSGEPDTEAAFEAAKDAVLKNLKAPATAQFPEYAAEFVDDLEGGQFRVTSYVDAQNGFGAMIRNDFTCVVVVERDDGSRYVNPFSLVIE